MARRLVLSPERYWKLKHEVLIRDDYQCRCCKRHANLTHHHVKYRSQGGDDAMENLLTVCAECHEKIHRKTLKIYQQDGDGNIIKKGLDTNLDLIFELTENRLTHHDAKTVPKRSAASCF